MCALEPSNTSVPQLRRWQAAAALHVAWFIFFAGALTSSGVPYYRDVLVTSGPLRHYINSRLRAGELPQWYPFESLGIPLIGQVATTLFHPISLLMLPFDALTAIKCGLLLAYYAGLMGAYRLARFLPASRFAAVTAAIAYGFGGYGLGMSSIFHYVISQATLPWVVLFGLRLLRRHRTDDCAYLGLAWASIFLAGDAQGFLLCGGVLIVLWANQRSLRGGQLLFAAAVIAALLCAVELLPAQVLSARSLRVLGKPSETINSVWAMHPLRLPELAVAGFIPEMGRARFLDGLTGNAKGPFCTTVFAGSLTLVLAAAGIASRRRLAWVFSGISAGGLWLSLGSYGGLLPLVQQIVPILIRFRFPEKYLAFFWLGLCPLVALGTEKWLEAPRRWRIVLFAGAALAIAATFRLSAWGLAENLWNALGQPIEHGDPFADLVDETWATGMASAAGFLLLGGLLLSLATTRRAIIYVLPVAVFAELWLANAEHLPLLPPESLVSTPPFAAAILATQRPNEPLDRVLHEAVTFFPVPVVGPLAERQLWTRSLQTMLGPDTAGLYGITSLGQNMGGESFRHHLLLRSYSREAARYGALLNGCFHVVDLQRPVSPDESELARDETTSMKLLSTPCKPRAYLSGTTAVATMQEALLATQKLPDTVVWENGPELPAAQGNITWRRANPENLLLDVTADATTGLIVSNEFGPGWTATVDGVEVPLYKAMVTAGGLVIPAGKHWVEFTYKTPRLLLGAALTGLGILLAAAAVASARKCRV